MRKHITALLLCLLLCCGAMIPLVAEMVQIRQMEATQATEPTQPGIQIDTATEKQPEENVQQASSSIKIRDPNGYLAMEDVIGNSINGYGIASEGKLDWQGVYFPYTGGEMELELFLQTTYKMKEGVAVMLFLNGRPQPFALAEGSRTAYQHTVYPGPGETSVDISFVPVQGSEGETMELCVLYYPAYAATATPEGNWPWYQEKNAKFFMLRMEMEATPPAADYPEIQQRLVEGFICDQAAQPSLSDYWTVNCDGKPVRNSIILGTNPMFLNLQFQLYSGSRTAYVLTIYVDDEPVWYLPWMPETEQADYRKLIQARLDCLDFEGEHTVFALLLKQHYWTYGSGWEDYPDECQLRVIHIQAP